MNEEKPRRRGRTSLLTGAAVFLALVVYLNIRLPGPAGTVDWIVMGAGGALFVYALLRSIHGAS